MRNFFDWLNKSTNHKLKEWVIFIFFVPVGWGKKLFILLFVAKNF